MRVLNRYIMGDFLRNFFLTLVVLTFVMYIGTIVQAIDYMSRGISGTLIMKIFAVNMPYILGFVIPMSILTTTLLHFGRLSADGEITAMKASGISMWQIAAPVLFASVLLSLFCLYLNADLSPRSHYARRTMVREFSQEDPLALIEEGKTVSEFPGIEVYVGKKDGNRLQDIVIHQFGKRGLQALVRAQAGIVNYDPETQTLDLVLEQARMTEYDEQNPGDLSKTRNLSAAVYPLHLDLSTMLRKGTFNKKPSDCTFAELVQAQQDIRAFFPNLREEEIPRMRAKLATDAAQRLALALSCFAFTLIAIPLGLTSHRKESSIGIGLALIVAFFFYLFIIISDTMVDHKPEWRPDLVPWIPVVLCQLLGLSLIYKHR